MFKKSELRRITASLLSLVMIIASLPISLIAYAGDPAAPDGIGVVNTAYTSETDDYTSYKVEFYYKDSSDQLQKLTTIPEIDDGTGFYIDADGKFTVAKNQSINLLTSQKIKNLINDRKILKVQITCLPTEDNTNPKDYLLYSSTPGKNAVNPTEGDITDKNTVVYTLIKESPKMEDGQPVVEPIYEDGEIVGYKTVMESHPLVDSDYGLSTFVSTELVEHEVDVYWHDTGDSRPTINSIEILQDGLDYEVLPTSDSPVIENSNHTVYKYSVPLCDETGHEYSYTAGDVDYTQSGKAYSLDSDGGNNRFDFYSKRTFDFSINWLQGQSNIALHTEQEIIDYITGNFDLYDETDYEVDANNEPILDANGNRIPKKLTIDASKITITGTKNAQGKYEGPVQISISDLYEITSDGRAKAYFLQKKTDGNIPISGSNDSWKVISNNLGIHSSDTEKVYQGATIDNVKTGTIDFSVGVTWNDSANRESRLSNTSPGSVVLWRYANASGNDTPEDRERSAQAATGTLVQTDANGVVIEDGKPIYLNTLKFDDLEKYDRFGNEYVYYVKEKLDSTLGSYQAVYSDTDCAKNGGHITNNLAGTRNFVVEAEWKAAARQGGTASVTYEVQKLVNGVWQTVGTPMMDAEGNYLKVKTDEHGDPVLEGGNLVYEITEDINEAATIPGLTIDNFKAETMKQTGRFGSLPMYDDAGNLIEYRVVQTGITRTDGSESDTYNELTIGSTSSPITINGDEYNIAVSHNGDTYNFTYQLTGNMPLDIKKIWDDSKFHQLHPELAVPTHDSDVIKASVRQYIFENNRYETFTVPTDPQAAGYNAENASHFDGDHNVFSITKSDSLSSGETTQIWGITIQVPIYDADGHEYQYDVTESDLSTINTGTHDGSYNSRVSYTPKNSDPNSKDTYTITNSYAEGPGYSVVIKKDWKDDGDMLHRKAINVAYDMQDGKTGTAVLSEANVWEEHISKNENYVYSSDHFTESRNDGTSSVYSKIATIKNDYSFTATFNNLEAGTYRISQKNGEVSGNTPNWIIVKDSTILSQTGSISVNLDKITKLLLERKINPANAGDPEWEAVTPSSVTASNYSGSTAPSFTVNSDKTVSITYGGKTTYTLNSDNTSLPTGFEWINYLTNFYENNANTKDLKNEQIVKFDNLVAVYKDDNHYYAVEQTHSGDGAVTFVNTRIGVVSYEIDLDLCLGGWENTASAEDKKFKVRIKGKVNGSPLKYSGTNTEVSIEEEITIQDGLQKYYLTNLPKYDSEGKIIDWEIEEIEFAGQTVGIGSNVARSCTIDGKTCAVSSTSPAYTYGEISHSDDLINVKITNRFKGTTSATVNKLWYDDNNVLGYRGDTYIQLWYKSKDPSVTSWQQLGGDYVWTSTEDTQWHYSFSGLEEFDQNGYLYDYAIKELSVSDYVTSEYSSFSPVNGTGTPASEQMQEQRMVPNGGWFVDKLTGEVVVDGKKLWNNISTVLDKSHYPIANIEIIRQDKYRITNDPYVIAPGEFSEEPANSGTYVANTTVSNLSKGTYRVLSNSQGLTISPSDDQTINVNDFGEINVTLTVSEMPSAPVSFKLQYRDNDVWKDHYNLMTTSEDQVKIGQTSIYNGDNTFAFKKDISWYDDPENNSGFNPHEIKEGYYVKDGNDPKTENLGTAGSPVLSMILPKFDDYGALITYNYKEVPIQGYVFEISNDKIVNDYNGGRPVEIAVTKKWDNMDNVQYPSVKLILHQIIFAKTMNAGGTDYVMDAVTGEPVLTPVEYATYEKVLKKGDEGCTASDEWTYTFGKMVGGVRVNPKENIRQFAPDGSCFQYYITEELINNDGEKVILNALDKDVAGAESNPQNAARTSDGYLGTFLQADAIYDEIVSADSSSTFYKYHTTESPYISVADDGLGFKVKEMTQPLQITDTGDDECTSENIDQIINRTATIKNSYEPDIRNFEGELIIDKTWKNYDGTNENGLNNHDFDHIKDYTFIVSRLTKNISERELFKIETYNSTDQKPKVTSIDQYFNFTVLDAMAKYDSSGHKISADDTTTAVEYYQETLKLAKDSYSSNLGEVKIVVTIYKTQENYNRVVIDGLAIYAQDAIRYSYKITEDLSDLKPYRNANDSDHPLSGKMEDFTENNQTVTKREYLLQNELKVFDLRLYKVFGKKFTPEGQSTQIIQKLDPSDYHQYFNDSFVTNNDNIQFQLLRKTADQADTEYEIYSYGGAEWHKVSGSGYSMIFRNIPKFSPDGKAYNYKVVEKDAPANAHYEVWYTANNSSTNYDQTDPVVITCTDDKTTYKNTYVRNVFEAKQIDVNKYWDDNDNADGLRPENVEVIIDEHIPSYNNGNPETIKKVLATSDLNQGNYWTQKVELPKYYYNGSTPLSGLTYGIKETTDPLDDNGYKAPVYTYMTSKDGLFETKSLGADETISVSSDEGGTVTELEALSVYNSKDPVNSELTFDKQWNDKENEWELRPDHIYVKVSRDIKDIVNISKKGNFSVSGNMSVRDNQNSKDVINGTIRNLPEGTYKIQQLNMVEQSDGNYQSEWVDLISDYTEETGNPGVYRIDFTADVVNKSMMQMFRIIDTSQTEPDNIVKLDKDGKDLVVIVNDVVASEIVKNDNSGYTLGAKDTTPLTVSNSGNITLPEAKAIEEQAGVLITALDKYSNDIYTYHVLKSDNASDFSGATEITSPDFAQNATGRNTVSVSAKNTENSTVYFKLTRSVGAGAQSDVTSGFEVTGGHLNTSTGIITVDAGESVLIEELSQYCEYEYKVYDGSTQLNSSAVEVRNTTDSQKVDVLAFLDDVTADKTLTVRRIADGGTEETVSGFTAYRFFAADSTTGVVALPVDNSNGNDVADNPIVHFENLSYGVLDGSGNWKPYYYTTIECDKYGYDVDSKLSSSQTADESDITTASVDVEFKINVQDYKAGGSDARKHINIKIVDQNNNIVKKDVNNNYIRVTIDGVDYFASNSTNNTPTEGVIVIPVSADSDYITCTVHDLPYAPANSDGTFDTEHTFRYTAVRCKVNSNNHNNSLTLVSYEGDSNYLVKPETTPATTTVTYSKTWTEYAVNAGLKPEKLHLMLYRTIAGEASSTAEEVNAGSYSDIDVALANLTFDNQIGEYKYTGTIEDLPAGKVVDRNGVGIWRKYTYFFKEYHDSALTEEKNGNISYDQFTQTKGEDKPFVLNDGNVTAELSEGVKNSLTTTKHDVVKKWVDNDDEEDDQGSTKPENREDYYVKLQRRAGVEGAWENVDLTKTAIQTVEISDDTEIPSEYANPDIQTIGSGADAYTVLKVKKDELHIRFDLLPNCDDKGAPYQYRVVEVKIGNQTIREDNTTLFLVPGTEPTDEEYSYVRFIHRGSNNYLVNYNYDDPESHCEVVDFDYSNYATEPTRITNQTITPITFSHIEATKKWEDEENVYGKRPEKITFHLTRTKNGDPDTSFASNKTVGEAENWTCKWEQLAGFAADGDRFEYFVEELPVANYTTSVPVETAETVDGITTRKVTFTNTYLPPKKTLSADKLWQDNSDYYNLRPDSVTYELYCKYDIYNYTEVKDEDNKVIGRTYTKQQNGYSGPVYIEGETNPDAQSQVYQEILKAYPSTDPSRFKVTINETDPASDKWSTVFTDLPAWINTTADERFNGKAVEVTYYIVETFSAGDDTYKKVYNCETSNGRVGSSKDTWVLEKGLVYTGYSKDVNGVYAVPASIAVDGTLGVLIRDLPVADVDREYTYNVTETDGNGNTLTGTGHSLQWANSTFVESAGLVASKQIQDRTDLLITATNVTSGNIYFKVGCTETIVDEKYKDDLSGCTFSSGLEQDSTSKVLRYNANHSAGTVTMTIFGLPKYENGKLCTYEAVEYASDVHEEAVPLILSDSKKLSVTSTIDDPIDPNKVNVTVTKLGSTENQKIYFRIKRSTTTNSNKDTILDEKTAQPLLICGADEDPVLSNTNTVDNSPVLIDEISSANLGVDDSTSSDYRKNVLIENDIVCIIANGSDTSLTINGLPRYNPYGYAYQYSVVEYSGYSPNAAAKNSTTMTASSAVGSDPSKVNVTVSKASSIKNEKVCFRLQRSVLYTQANGLGDFTVLKSEESSGTSILNSLNTRNIIVALDWEDNEYLDGEKIASGAHSGEDKINELHYNTEIKLSCDDLNVNNSTDTYSQTKTITVENKYPTGENRTYVTKYGVYFKDLPKYDLSGNAYDYSIEQKIGTAAPNDEVYNYQLVDAYDDVGNTSGKKLLTNETRKLGENIAESKTGAVTLLEVKDGTNNDEGRKYSYGTSYTSYTDDAQSADYVTQYNIRNTLPLTSVTVVKEWDDSNDKFGLRPDSIDLKLERSKDGLSTAPASAYIEDANNFEDVPYFTHEVNTQANNNKFPVKATVTNGKDTWTYTYKTILKCDDKNNPYIFKITEDFTAPATHINGYLAPTYVRDESGNENGQIVDATDVSSYTGTGDKWDGTHPLAENFYIQNELDTRDITVAKVWNDNGYGGTAGNDDIAKNLHYDLALTLTGTIKGATAADNQPLKWTKNNQKVDYSETYRLTKDSKDNENHPYAVKFTGLPKFDKNGNVIVYKVSESRVLTGAATPDADHLTTTIAAASTAATSEEFTAPVNDARKYGYDGTCKKVEAGENGSEYVTQYTITNTLPLTAVKVNKHWDDQNNAYGLRPTTINDKNKGETAAANTYAIDLTLQRKSGNGNYTAFTHAFATSENINSNYKNWYDSTDMKKTPVDSTANKNEWTYTYTKLLKYDSNNAAYSFKIVEKQGSNNYIAGYEEPHYCAISDYDTAGKKTEKQTITAVNVNNPASSSAADQLAWDGTHTLVQEFEITNRLDTRDIIVTKAWVDNDNTDTRYNLAITLSNDKTSNTETKYLAKTETTKGLKFVGLPKYDKDGEIITYKVTEAYDDGTNTAATGDDLGNKITGGTSSNASGNEFEVDSYKYGYVGSCKTVTVDGIVEEFDITNTLPMITFEANKEWNDENNRDYRRPTSVSFNLQRKIHDYPTDPDVIAAMPTPEKGQKEYSTVAALTGEDRTASYKTGDTVYWTASFGKYPQYSFNNYLYDYIVEENVPADYSSDYVLGSDTTLTDDTETTQKNYTFTNTHDITEQTLTVEKKWVDDEFKDTTRPTELSDINVELWCSYTDLNGEPVNTAVSADTTGLKDHIDAAFAADTANAALVADGKTYKYKTGLDTFTASDDDSGTTNYDESQFISTYQFKYLPIYINVDGTAVENGDGAVSHWQAVTYYVKETFDDTNNIIDKNYDDYYSAPEKTSYETSASYSTGTNMLKDNTVLSEYDTEDKTIYIENRPVTRDISVDKAWADHGYYTEAYRNNTLHYDIDVELDCSSLSTTVANRHDSSNKYSETKTIAKNSTTAVTFSDLPKYDKDGNELVYSITEAVHSDTALSSDYERETLSDNSSTATNKYDISVTNHKFGYVGSCTATKDSDNIVTALHITNTLPLTAVEVEKTWEDNVGSVYDAYCLRPALPTEQSQTDPLALALTQRKSGTEDSWAAPVYSVKSLPTASNNNDKWTYTYTKLLKYTEDNVPYSFRIAEGTVPNGYELKEYQKQELVKTTGENPVDDLGTLKNSATEWNGTNVLATPLQVTNKLDTRDIIVTKTWDDNDYDPTKAAALHYDLKVNLTGTIIGTGGAENSALKWRNTTNTTVQETYSNVKVLGKDAKDSSDNKLNLIFKGLPKYDKNGNVIVYKITEEKATGTYTVASGENNVTTVTRTAGSDKYTSETSTTSATFERADFTGENKAKNAYGYEGNCAYIVNYDNDSTKEYVEQFDITNELPLTTIEVTKTWQVDDAYHSYSADSNRNITFTVTRSPEADNDSEKTYSSEHTVVCSSGSTATTTIDKQLVYNYDNAAYTYSVAENIVQGYTTDYPTESAVAVKDGTETLDIRNTQITQNVKLQKIDYTYYERYRTNDLYSDIGLNNAEFELYIKNGSDEVKVPVTRTEDPDHSGYYYYKYDFEKTKTAGWDSVEGCNVVKSEDYSDGSKGMIDIRGLPMNTYYLREKTAPGGFLLNRTGTGDSAPSREFCFVVDVNGSNTVTKNYSSSPATPASVNRTVGNTTVYNNNGFIDHNTAVPKIGNAEIPRSLTLVKVDETDNSIRLENATYYLLYLKPYSLSGTDSESEYQNAAVNAVKTSGGLYTAGVAQYWDIDKIVQTDSNGLFTESVENLRHGIYTLMEVQAPVGYNVNNSGFAQIEYIVLDANGIEHTETHTDAGQLLVTLDRTHISCDMIHEDPRCDATLDIYKQDEFGNPLEGAEFELYYRPNGNPSATRPDIPGTESTATLTPVSDNDYVFFMDNLDENNELWVPATISSTYDETARKKYGQVEISNENDKMMYQFYDSGGDPIGSPAQAWEKYGYFSSDNINDYCVVYKAQVPDGAAKVKFYSVGTNQRSTVTFDIVKGAAYRKTETKTGELYNVVAWDRTNGNMISDPVAAEPTVSFIPSENKIVVRLNSYYDWDDLHVYFWDAGDQAVGQPYPGYCLESYSDSYPLEFELTIPENAVNFQFNNGVKVNYALNKYQTADNELLHNNNQENGGNFYEFASTAQINDRQNFALNQWSSVKEIIEDLDTESDYDYVFFTDNGAGWTGNGNNKMYAHFFDDSHKPFRTWPGIEATGSYIDSNGFTVYKFRYPTGYTHVVFSCNGKQTVDIEDFQKGRVYSRNDSTDGAGHYNVGYIDKTTASQTYSYTAVNDTTDPLNNYIYITDDTGNWDDLHVFFFRGTDTPVNQPMPGYYPEYIGTDSSGKWYRIEIPEDAEKFSLNNGEADLRPTAETEVINGGIYALKDTVVNGKYKLRKVYPADVVNTVKDDDIHIATVRTGEDGLADEVTFIDSNYAENSGNRVVVKNWGTYFWKEVTPPGGYDLNTEVLDTFEVDAEKADMTVYIEKVGDTRIKGRVRLTKTAEEAAGNTAVGEVLMGAKFKLCESGSTDPINVIRKTNGIYVVKPVSLEGLTVSDFYNENSSIIVYDLLETDNTGRITLEGIEWGSYYLEETAAPDNSGYSVYDTSTGQPNKVNFTVGRNNCEVMQELGCKDEAQKAKITISKNINERKNAWGDPTFIFRLKQTHKYVGGVLNPIDSADQPEKVVSITLSGDDLSGSVEDIEVLPGTYEVTEQNVSRYEYQSCTVTLPGGTIPDDGHGKATFTINADQTATVAYVNKLEYYDKFSQVDCKVNNFNGYKAIRVEYNTAIPVDVDTAEIPKSSLSAYLVDSSGKETAMTEQQKANLVLSYVSQPDDDSRFAGYLDHRYVNSEVTENTDSTKLTIARPEFFIDGVYKLKAKYDVDGNSSTTVDVFETIFDIHFESADHSIKEYEKTFIFKVDDNNRSYFNEGAGTAQYAFEFIMIKNGQNEFEVHSIRHNGTVIAEGSGIANEMNAAIAQMNSMLTINEAYAYSVASNPEGLEFEKWKNGAEYFTKDQITFSSLETLAKTNSDTVTFTAMLKEHSDDP